ncbi:hypothetical protein IB267_14305 [Ensifer sp. ENS09]|uniref:hypothetical protein n=1 Tax=Ensifer sp. ENS09 TaxID=2769263 RepID=UPI00177F6F39|nr:hypothetical protein [Ensifer sp. ENS09]MBD9649532.1 hypothetical protein [Ensifer sp. ENS09]
MLLPTQQSAATATTNLVGSILRDIEKRQTEEEEKAKGTKDDRLLREQVKPDGAQKAANEKINGYFFDHARNDASNNRAVLIREVGKIFGVERETFKSDAAFAREIENQLKEMSPGAIAGVEKALGLHKLSISLSELIQALKNPTGRENDLLKAALGETADKGPQSTAQAANAVDRLARATEPQSIKEAQLDSLRSDPTRRTDKLSLDEEEQKLRALQLKDEMEDVADQRAAGAPSLLRFDDNGLYRLAALSL